MRLARIRTELRSQRYGIAMGAIALLVAIGAPAQALEGATSAATSAAKALKIAKKADKRSKKALRLATKVSKEPGPRGPAGNTGAQGARGQQGAPGSDAQLNGAAAGGDLTGTYPNPQIGGGSVTSAKLAGNLNDVLDANDINTNGVSSTELADNAVDAGALQASSVTQSKLDSGGASVPLMNFPNMTSGACATLIASSGLFDVGDLALPQALIDLGDGVYLEPTVVANDNNAIVKVCNGSNADRNPPEATFLVNAVAP